MKRNAPAIVATLTIPLIPAIAWLLANAIGGMWEAAHWLTR